MEVIGSNIEHTINFTDEGYNFSFEPGLVRRDENDSLLVAADSTGICKYFLKGNCTKGTNCQFRHSKSERSIVCKHWLRALCKKGDAGCEFLHKYDLSRMPECYFFSKFAECNNPECMYLHVNPEDKVKECPWYARGFCKHGPNCRHKHVKKVICDNYYVGFCPLGPNCKFGHPREAKEIENTEHLRKSMVVCHKCGIMGHKASHCPTYPTEMDLPYERRSLNQVTCYKCGQLGHYADKCPNPPLSYQQQQQAHGKNKSYYQQQQVQYQRPQPPRQDYPQRIESMDLDG